MYEDELDVVEARIQHDCNATMACTAAMVRYTQRGGIELVLYVILIGVLAVIGVPEAWLKLISVPLAARVIYCFWTMIHYMRRAGKYITRLKELESRKTAMMRGYDEAGGLCQ